MRQIKIDLSSIKHDQYGRIEEPVLVLKTMHENTIGTIGSYSNLKINPKFNELSEITFDVPSVLDTGEPNPIFDRITGFKIVQADPYGKFILMKPSEENDGIRRVKSCTGKSLEYQFTRTNIVLEEGTYCLYDPTNTNNTIMGIILEDMPDWGMGEVAPTLLGRYRTFSDTDVGALDFLYGQAQQSYGCLFVFDSYTKTIDIIDADEESAVLPIYLSLDNFLKDISQEELDDDVFTVLSVYGADPVTINSVNPTGSSKIYNLDWFIENGDIDEALAARWRDWETLIDSKQDFYSTLLRLRAAETSRKQTESARLTDMEGELASLTNIRDVIATAVSEKIKEQEELDAAISDCNAKEKEIEEQKALLESIQTEIDTYTTQIEDFANECKIGVFFTPDELSVLRNYFQESSFTDDTFAVFDVDISGDSNSFFKSANCSLEVTGATITDVPLEESWARKLYAIVGGTVTIASEECVLSSSIIDGTFERKDNGEAVASFYLGSGTLGETAFLSGTLTITGNVPEFTTIDGSPAVFDEISIYFTRNVTEYQQYAVEKELYEYAKDKIKDIAWPSFSFEVNSANIVFAKESESFKDALRLGSAIYLRISDDAVIKPLLLELSINYERPDQFEMIFSNEYRRPDAVNTLQDILADSVNTSRQLDMSKYQYGAFSGSGASTFVQELIQFGLDTAKLSITNSETNSVTYDGRGLQIRAADDPAYIHMNNGGIWFVDGDTGDVKMGVGRFKDNNVNANGTLYGVVAPNIIGTLIAGENLVIENTDINGDIMQFRVDSSGAFLNNSRFYLQKDGGGKIAIDPQYGIAAGISDLYQMDGTNVIPSFIDSDGSLIFEDGMPKNTNFFLDLRDGNAYFKGKVYATDGYFMGTVQANDFIDSDGNSMLTSDGKFDSTYLDLGNITIDGDTGNIKMTGDIDMGGSITMGGSINMTGSMSIGGSLDFTNAGAITWGGNAPVKYQFSMDGSSNWHDDMTSSDKYRRDSLDGGTTWGDPYQFKGTDGKNGSDANVPAYIRSTYIDLTRVESPYILGNLIEARIPEFADTDDNGFLVSGFYNGRLYDAMRIGYAPNGYDGFPGVTFSSPSRMNAAWDFGITQFNGTCIFNGTVYGITATFG